MAKRKPQRAPPEVNDPYGPRTYEVAERARGKLMVLLDKGGAVNSEEALAIVGPVVAFSQPGSPARRMTWLKIAADLSTGKFKPDDMWRSRWPNGNETLVQ